MSEREPVGAVEGAAPVEQPAAVCEHGRTGSHWYPNSACVERWPECISCGYDRRCCRFPKSCSADERCLGPVDQSRPPSPRDGLAGSDHAVDCSTPCGTAAARNRVWCFDCSDWVNQAAVHDRGHVRIAEGQLGAFAAGVRAEAVADALNSAADDLYSDDGPGNLLSTATWLRARAAGSVPVATPEPCDHGHLEGHWVTGTNQFGYGSTSSWCPGPVATPTVPTLVGIGEAAEILGVTKARVHQLASRLPEPTQRLAMGPVWTETSIRNYAASRSIKRGPVATPAEQRIADAETLRDIAPADDMAGDTLCEIADRLEGSAAGPVAADDDLALWEQLASAVRTTSAMVPWWATALGTLIPELRAARAAAAAVCTRHLEQGWDGVGVGDAR